MTTLQHIAPATPRTISFWRAFRIHMRPYLLFVSGITGVAGLAFVGDFSPAMGTLFGVAFFLSYGFGQALTDCFQTDTDSISSPYRPLVQGIVSPSDLKMVSILGLAACGAVMVLGNVLAAPLAFLGILGLVTYTYFKRRWWAGPFYNAWIVVVVYLLGVLDGAPAGGLKTLSNPVVLATSATVFFGYANFVLSGYFKDVSADHATGYDTLPVHYGLRISTLVSDGFAAVTVAVAGVALYQIGWIENSGTGLPVAVALFGVAGVGAAIVAQVRLHHVHDEQDAHRAISPVVHAYVLLLSAITVAQEPSWTSIVVASYAAFWITMRRRPEDRQI